jgi:hypothetical protein
MGLASRARWLPFGGRGQGFERNRDVMSSIGWHGCRASQAGLLFGAMSAQELSTFSGEQDGASCRGISSSHRGGTVAIW